MKNKNILLLAAGLIVVGMVIYGFINVVGRIVIRSGAPENGDRATKAYEDCVGKWPPELCKMFNPEERVKSYELCAKIKIPKEADDTAVYSDNKIAVIRWWDGKLQDNVVIYLPYEPETGFAGCSESAKSFLERAKAIQIP